MTGVQTCALPIYLADPKEGPSSYTVRLACTPNRGEAVPRVLTLTINEERGRVGEVAGWSETPLRLTGFGGNGRTMTARAKLRGGEELGLRFRGGVRPEGSDVFTWFPQEWLLYELLVADIPGEVLLDGREVASFVASLGEVRDAEQHHLRPVPEEPTSESEGADSPAPRLAVGIGGPAVAGVAIACATIAGAAVAWVIWRRKRISRGTRS